MIRLVILRSGVMLVGNVDDHPDVDHPDVVESVADRLDLVESVGAKIGLVRMMQPAVYQVSPLPQLHPVTHQPTLGSAGILHFLGVAELFIAWDNIAAMSSTSGADLDMYERALKRRQNDPGQVVHAA